MNGISRTILIIKAYLYKEDTKDFNETFRRTRVQKGLNAMAENSEA